MLILRELLHLKPTNSPAKRAVFTCIDYKGLRMTSEEPAKNEKTAEDLPRCRFAQFPNS